MDRTGQNVVFICALVLLLLYIYTTPPAPPSKPKAVAAAITSQPASLPAFSAQPGSPGPTAVAEQLTIFENATLRITFTSQGAAIKQIELKEPDGRKQVDDSMRVILNEKSHTDILQLAGWPGADHLAFTLTQNSPDGVVYSADLPGGVKWTRSYAFSQIQDADAGMSGLLRKLFNKIARHLGGGAAAPLVYNLEVADALANRGATDVALPAYSLSVGRAQPLLVRKHYQMISNQYLGAGWYTTKFHLTTVNDFNPSTIPLIGLQTHEKKDLFTSTSLDEGALQWLGVENQFYTVLLTPATDHPIQHAVFQCFNQRDSNGYVLDTRDPSGRDEEGYLLPGLEPDIEAAAFFPALTVPAGKTVTLNYSLYAGPKDFNRLDALGTDQGALMNYDGFLPFSILIVPMLTVLHFWYLIFHNYGVAIILLTLMIKAITWPLQSIANQSGKRMQALAPKLKELQAKYKEQPEKLQTETFGIYREYGVNPFGGCLPALVQMPVFFSLYFMLQNAVELRGQSFLWVRDLTQPDSVFTVALPFVVPWLGAHFSLNLLPIMVTGLTMVMMRLTPQMGDPAQAKIIQFMPLVFLFIFYNFAAALSLYYVINNCVSIIQIYRNLKKPLPELKRKPRKKTE